MQQINQISDISVGEFLIDTEVNNNLVRVDEITTNSVGMWLLKNQDFYIREVQCDTCMRNYLIQKTEKFKCSNQVQYVSKDTFEVYMVDGKVSMVNCRGKAIEIKKIYTGVDCSQYFQFGKFFTDRFKKQ